MRILFWTEQFWPSIGGVEVLSSQLVRELRRRGHDLLVVTSHGSSARPDQEEYEGTAVERFRFREPLDARDPMAIAGVRRRLSGLRSRFAPELLHLNFSGPSAYYHLATLAVHPCPWLVTVHQALPESATRPDSVSGKMLRLADWVVGVSESILADLRRLVAGLEPRSSVVYNGLELPASPSPPLPWDPPRLLCVGRLVPEKGFDLAVLALPSLLERFPPLRMTIAGDGPVRRELEELAAFLGVAHAVDFMGWVAPRQIGPLMRAATAVVMPSRWEEPFGLVAVEAALHERPVVATRAGALPEVVADGATGLIVPREDPAALAAALQRLLQEREQAEELGRRGRLRAEEMFTLARVTDGYERIYRNLASGASESRCMSS